MKYTAILILAAVNGAFAQSAPRTIKGIVVDSANHKPISQAVIYVGRTTAGRTGNDGTFRVSADPDPTVLMVRRLGYIPALVALPQDTTATEKDLGTLSLPPVKTDADRAVVQDVDTRMFPELASFYDHKARFRQGVFLTPDDLERLGGNLFGWIRQKQGFHFICIFTRRGDVDCGQEASRGRTSISNPRPTSRETEPCLLSVWTNALRPQHTLDEFQMSDVLAVEAFPTPGVTPPEFAGSPCATIMLWMKHGGPVTAHP
ncbi:MAG: hypothetical protein AUG85_10975 [Gemmatimonadetes bacterium 13_1_20CM_4_66_11]|nr:MAG: hypothetical protein AUI09_01480 [Gemmatimonadetes bacterium 13_2_20CM_2_66_5]OLC88502.1 MAG: hypothetical protein AUI86_03660 [Gemmatimonadetes bacterium 13_1_40CM_3_66_12]OLD86196.1 MAG: hypothetical protein AUG85_10975 [Gemmatimonadetes bacterium 13_1_20CM_4_66_11]